MSDELDIKTLPVLETEPADSVVLAFTSYARRDLLSRSNGKLYGNWERSFAAACVMLSTNKFIYEAAIINKQKVGNCPRTGKEIWLFEHH